MFKMLLIYKTKHFQLTFINCWNFVLGDANLSPNISLDKCFTKMTHFIFPNRNKFLFKTGRGTLLFSEHNLKKYM